MSNPDRIRYKPSPVVLMGKAVLTSVGRVTPASWYRVLYRRVDWAYRRSMRFLYVRFWAWAALSGNPAARRRARRVFTVMPYSLVGWSGLEATHDAVSALNREKLSGSIVECGVAQGGCAALMAVTDQEQHGDRSVWLCDSYEGLPDPTAADFEHGASGTHASDLVRGSCLGTTEQVSELLFRRFGLDPAKVTLVKGWFQDTLPDTSSKMAPIALLRIDADWFESVKCCLNNLFDLVIPGGFVIIDDYGSCFGAQKAVDSFLADRGLRVALVHDRRGGCHFRKPA